MFPEQIMENAGEGGLLSTYDNFMLQMKFVCAMKRVVQIEQAGRGEGMNERLPLYITRFSHFSALPPVLIK